MATTWLPDADLPAELNQHPGWKRLEEQRQWYAAKAAGHQRGYRRLKVAQIILASAVPLFALLDHDTAPWGRWAAAISGAVIAILEAIQQLNQSSRLWVEYRGMAERLKREKYLFLAGAGPYDGLDIEKRLAALSLRVEDQISTEHERWVANAGQAAAAQGGAEAARTPAALTAPGA